MTDFIHKKASTVALLGYDVYAGDCNSCVEEVLFNATSQRAPTFIACLNPHSIVTAAKDVEFFDALSAANYRLPDGVGVVIGAHLLGTPLQGRIPGMDFFIELSKCVNNSRNFSYYFLGSTTTVLQRIATRMAREFPNIHITGAISPPFEERLSADETKSIVNEINSARTDVLWVGMTAPKQEKWIYEALPQLNVRIVVAIGAVFDFYAGTRKRAPEWMCNLGLEWLPRLVREPTRLWKRNLVSSPIYMGMVLREIAKRKIKGSS